MTADHTRTMSINSGDEVDGRLQPGSIWTFIADSRVRMGDVISA